MTYTPRPFQPKAGPRMKVLTPAVKLRVMQEWDTINQLGAQAHDAVRDYMNLYMPLADMIVYGFVTEVSVEAREEILDGFREECLAFLNKMYGVDAIEWAEDDDLDSYISSWDRTSAAYDARARLTARSER